jgi:hypothetical protein
LRGDSVSPQAADGCEDGHRRSQADCGARHRVSMQRFARSHRP